MQSHTRSLPSKWSSTPQTNQGAAEDGEEEQQKVPLLLQGVICTPLWKHSLLKDKEQANFLIKRGGSSKHTRQHKKSRNIKVAIRRKFRTSDSFEISLHINCHSPESIGLLTYQQRAIQGQIWKVSSLILKRGQRSPKSHQENMAAGHLTVRIP